MADPPLAQNRALRSRIEVASDSVCAVTVTYGNRQHLLRKVLLAILKQPQVRSIVVVNNGAQWDVQALAAELASRRIEVIDLQSNRGSAVGFSTGIKRACELGADFIWLLDDDNEPQECTLTELLAAYAHLRMSITKDKLMLLAYRPMHQRSVAYLSPPGHSERRPSSFWHFHVFDVPQKLWHHTPWGRLRFRKNLPPQVEMTNGPYGGLIFHPAVIETHGLPRADFVVYDDDVEFTYRFTNRGGTLRLITAAKLVDLDESWHFTRNYGNSFRLWLQGGNDTRVFFGARNHTYLDTHCYPHNRFMYWINRKIYCSVMWVFAIFLRRIDRYQLLQNAIRDGLAGRLGVTTGFPLS